MKPHYLPALPYLALNRAVWPIEAAYDPLGVFLVGSCLVRADFRDVDVRCILRDEDYDRHFPGGEGGQASDVLWSLVCEGIGALLERASGLPIDFQIQRMTEANAMHQLPRNALLGAATPHLPGRGAVVRSEPGDRSEVPLMTEDPRIAMKAAMDELQALLHDAEDRLVALSYGVRAEVPRSRTWAPLASGRSADNGASSFSHSGRELSPCRSTRPQCALASSPLTPLPALERALDVAAVERHATILAAIDAAKAWLAAHAV